MAENRKRSAQPGSQNASKIEGGQALCSKQDKAKWTQAARSEGKKFHER